ncbi:hypothetical protein C1H46_037082 [Malus baccata]|uniref:Uncharacterized protein n=1 Tax=Malus baccata TaxID=106549 RepID=A0A540KTQ4_MALBA|nr:hypothetical protein C1H46_037082 [Malus baccata]
MFCFSFGDKTYDFVGCRKCSESPGVQDSANAAGREAWDSVVAENCSFHRLEFVGCRSCGLQKLEKWVKVQSLQHRHLQSLHCLINHKILLSINFPTLLTSLKPTASYCLALHSLHLARLFSVKSSVELSTMDNTNKGLNPAKKKDFVCLGVGRIFNLPRKKMNRLRN